MSSSANPPFIGLDMVPSDGDLKCVVCGGVPKKLRVIYLNRVMINLCRVCEGTLMSQWLNNYVRRHRRGRPVPTLVHDTPAPASDATPSPEYAEE